MTGSLSMVFHGGELSSISGYSMSGLWWAKSTGNGSSGYASYFSCQYYYQYSTLMILKLLSSEGQAGEDWESSIKTMRSR
jgi:hypothetical protein